MGECLNCKDNKNLIPTTMLWHYTSISLLNEFLKPEAKLYASHFAYVNDTQDCRVATKILTKVMGERIQWWRGAMQMAAFENLANEIDRGFFMPRFISCFSRAEDDLSQWRGYAPVRGVSIGFDEDALRAAIGTYILYPARIVLQDCFYKTQQELNEEVNKTDVDIKEDLEKRACYRDFLNSYNDNGLIKEAKYTKEETARLVERFEREWQDSLHKAEESIFWKHSAFAAEKEVRLAVMFDGMLPVRNIDVVGDIPRVAVPLKCPMNSLIRRIVIGPSVCSSQDELLAMTLVRKYCLEVAVSKSPMPYRGRS